MALGPSIVRRISALVVISISILAVSACNGGDDVADSSCVGPQVSSLAPSGKGFDTYTMLLRLNQSSDLQQFARPGLRDLIRDRDIFVINTTFPKLDPSAAEDLLSQTASEFPCNRIVSLNSLGQDSEKPEYEYALIGQPDLDAVMVDWEPDTVALLGKNKWQESLSANVAEARSQLKSISRRLPGDSNTRVGLVTQYEQGWDYAKLASELEKINRQISRDFLGYQVVQTQYSCGSTEHDAIGDVASHLRATYQGLESGSGSSSQPETDLLDRLGFEISFSTSPSPGATEVVEEDSPSDAAQCTQDILSAGGSAVIYWATPRAIEAMLNTPIGRSLRSPAS